MTISIGIKDWPGAAPSHLWTESFELPPTAASRAQELVADLIASQSESDRLLSPYSFEAREGRTSWGADGGPFLDIVLFLSGAAISGGIGIAVQKLYERVRSWIRTSEDGEAWHEPLTKDQAIASARWFLAVRYRQTAGPTTDGIPTSEDDLKVISESHDVDEGRWTITFQDQGSSIYRVTIAQPNGIPTTTQVERICDQR